MSATSVGQIGLDLVVNKNQFESQMAGITGMAKKSRSGTCSGFWSKKNWLISENSVWNWALILQKFRTL